MGERKQPTPPPEGAIKPEPPPVPPEKYKAPRNTCRKCGGDPRLVFEVQFGQKMCRVECSQCGHDVGGWFGNHIQSAAIKVWELDNEQD